ncbi:hypothetical protein AB9E19_34475, partial [Rhizobium leguminosarum]
GLAQFSSQAAGNPNSLIVGGYVMVGAILINKSPVTLKDVTPIARLTGDMVGAAGRAAAPGNRTRILLQRRDQIGHGL